MAENFQGLNKRINKGFEGLDVDGGVRGFVVNTVRDLILDSLKSKWLQDWISEKIGEAAAAAGFTLNLSNISDKETTKNDIDAAITAKVNALAGTTFTSLKLVNSEALRVEAGRLIGARMGVGELYPVASFRDTMAAQLLQAVEGSGNALFSAGTVQAIETSVLASLPKLTDKAGQVGNPMNSAGPPRDAAHAAVRAANRKRQAKYRAKNFLKWVPFGSGGAGSGNGREGLTGRASGNVKPVRNQDMYTYKRDE